MSYTILIVDDDLSTVDMLCHQIDWEQLGFSRILRAYNGQMAIDQILEHKPDVVLCDIEMPVKDGIEVLRWIRGNGIDALFILLTCHESFDFARDSISFNAFRYLTKPCDLEEISRTIAEAAAKLAAKAPPRDIKSNSEIMHKFYIGELPKEKERLSKLLAKNVLTPIDLDSAYRLVLSAVDLTQSGQQDWQDEMIKYAFRHLMRDAVLELYNTDYSFCTEFGGFYNVVMFVSTQRFDEPTLLCNCRKALQVCRRELNCIPSILVSDPMYLWQVSESRGKLESMLSRLLIYPGQVETVRTMAASSPAPVIGPDEVKIRKYMDGWELAAIIDYLDGYLDEMLATNAKNGGQVLHIARQKLLQIFYSFMADLHIGAEAVFNDPDLYAIGSKAEHSKKALLRFVEAALVRLRELSSENQHAPVVKQAIRYIEQNYTYDISRDDIAKAACVTPNYLSKLFHEASGKTIREYISDCRLREAQRLLKYTNKPISDIAISTGFGNISYFSTLFRKKYKMSPFEWRKKNSAE